MWKLTLRGGAFDRFEGHLLAEPPHVLIAYAACDGCVVTDDPWCPRVDERSATAYCRAAVELDARRAVYEHGGGAENVNVAPVSIFEGPRQ